MRREIAKHAKPHEDVFAALQRARVTAGESCFVIGIDPDTGGSDGGSGVVLATTKQVLAVGIAETRGKTGLRAAVEQRKTLAALLRGLCRFGRIDRAAIEIPIDYGQRRYADPNDLMRLSLISGVAGGVLEEFVDRVEWVEPFRWKGNRKKGPDHANTLTYFNWPFEWDRSKGGNKLPKWEVPKNVLCLTPIRASGKEEIADAMGLAYYALVKEGADGR